MKLLKMYQLLKLCNLEIPCVSIIDDFGAKDMCQIGESIFLYSVIERVVLWEIQSSIIRYDDILQFYCFIFQVQSECCQCIG